MLLFIDFTGLQDYRGLLTKGDVITGGINEKGSYLTNTFSGSYRVKNWVCE